MPPLWLLPLRMIGMGNPVVFCLFAAALFDDDFRPSWRHALAWLAMVAFGSLLSLDRRCAGALGLQRVGLVCNALGVWYALAGRSLDLVEERRRLRAVLVVLLAFYSAAIIAIRERFRPAAAGRSSYLANGTGCWRSHWCSRSCCCPSAAKAR